MFLPWTDNNTARSAVSSAILLGAILVAVPGCQQWMSNQPRVGTLKESEYFKNSSSARPQVEGTIARGQNVEETPVETGKQDGKPVARIPIEVDAQLLTTGREQFHIYCHHCHGMSGYGDGMVVQRGFPQPPSYHIPRLRKVEDGHLFDVITNGIARMPHFQGRIEPRKRWAIVAYIRALQLSQYAPQGDLSAQDMNALTEQHSGKD
jgi:mono/diheme cytochrome c family protein